MQYPACGTQHRMRYPAQHRNKKGRLWVKFGKIIFSFKFIFLYISFFLSFFSFQTYHIHGGCGFNKSLKIFIWKNNKIPFHLCDQIRARKRPLGEQAVTHWVSRWRLFRSSHITHVATELCFHISNPYNYKFAHHEFVSCKIPVFLCGIWRAPSGGMRYSD